KIGVQIEADWASPSSREAFPAGCADPLSVSGPWLELQAPSWWHRGSCAIPEAQPIRTDTVVRPALPGASSSPRVPASGAPEARGTATRMRVDPPPPRALVLLITLVSITPAFAQDAPHELLVGMEDAGF